MSLGGSASLGTTTPGGGLFLLGGTGSAAGSASGGPGGRTVRELDDGMRELKKENFNLKLRIYFLEERLGSRTAAAAGGASSSSASRVEELELANADFKVSS